jgi:hypothetical protein
MKKIIIVCIISALVVLVSIMKPWQNDGVTPDFVDDRNYSTYDPIGAETRGEKIGGALVDIVGTWQALDGGTITFEVGDVSTESPGYNDIYEGTFIARDIGMQDEDWDGWWNLDETTGTVFVETLYEDPYFSFMNLSDDAGRLHLEAANGIFDFVKSE